MNKCIIEDAKYVDKLNNHAKHAHECYEIIYLEEGTLDISINTKHYACNAPSLIFISKLEQHSIIVKGSTYKRYYLCISPVLASNAIQDYSLLTVLSNRHSDFCHVLDVSTFKSDIDRIFSSFIFEHNSNLPFSNQRQASLLSELLILIYRNAPSLFIQENDKSTLIVWKIQIRFEKNCSEQYSLESLANEYHLSPYYLSHLFKKVTGYPIMQYLIKCRLSLARKLLTDTNMSITDIVYNTGFSDSSNFSRLFKREMNVTPLQYRRSEQK